MMMTTLSPTIHSMLVEVSKGQADEATKAALHDLLLDADMEVEAHLLNCGLKITWEGRADVFFWEPAHAAFRMLGKPNQLRRYQTWRSDNHAIYNNHKKYLDCHLKKGNMGDITHRAGAHLYSASWMRFGEDQLNFGSHDCGVWFWWEDDPFTHQDIIVLGVWDERKRLNLGHRKLTNGHLSTLTDISLPNIFEIDPVAYAGVRGRALACNPEHFTLIRETLSAIRLGDNLEPSCGEWI